jgi:hypothetical protein
MGNGMENEMARINEIESQYVLARKPVLQESYHVLLQRWDDGKRDRETTLRLLFLNWLTFAEANFLTGLQVTNASPYLLLDLFEALGGEDTNDEEVWFVMSVMIDIAETWFGDEKYWVGVGEKFKRSLGDRWQDMDSRLFGNRGAYGDYFAHQVRSRRALRSLKN